MKRLGMMSTSDTRARAIVRPVRNWTVGLLLCCLTTGGLAAPVAAPGGLARHADWQIRVAPPSEHPWAEVQSVEPKSPADRAGLQAGDRITQVNGIRADKPSAFLDARRATRGGKPVRLLIQRKDQELPLAFTPRPMALESDPALQIDYTTVTTPAGYRQRALITRPIGASGKLPSLILVPWLSCATVEVLNRNATGMDRLLAGILRESGFLTLRVEKPGVGDSEGPACSQTDLTTEMSGERAALERLKAHPSFDPDRLFILGMSLGGGRAPLLGESENVRGYVSVVGLVKTWFEHMLEVERRRLILSGTPPAQVNDAMRGFAELYTQYLIHGRTPGEVIRENPALQALWNDEPAHQYGRPARFYTQVQALNLENAWQKVKAPTLIVAGEYDWIMSQDDYDRMAALVNANTPGAATLLRWPRASHELEQFPSREAAFNEAGGTFDAALIRQVVRWLTQAAAS